MHFSLKLHHFQTASSVLPVKMQEIIITAIDGQKTNGVHQVSVLGLEDSFGITPRRGISGQTNKLVMFYRNQIFLLRDHPDIRLL